MISIGDLYWLAGLLEGEGYFGFNGTRKTLSVNVSMTDRDVIEKAARLLGAKAAGKGRTGRPNELPIYRATVEGSAIASGWMMTLYPLMGIRRQAKIRSCLAAWRAQPISSASIKRLYYRLQAVPLCQHGGDSRYVKRDERGRILGSHCRPCFNARQRARHSNWNGLSGRKSAMAQRLPVEAWDHLITIKKEMGTG